MTCSTCTHAKEEKPKSGYETGYYKCGYMKPWHLISGWSPCVFSPPKWGKR